MIVSKILIFMFLLFYYLRKVIHNCKSNKSICDIYQYGLKELMVYLYLTAFKHQTLNRQQLQIEPLSICMREAFQSIITSNKYLSAKPIRQKAPYGWSRQAGASLTSTLLKLVAWATNNLSNSVLITFWHSNNWAIYNKGCAVWWRRYLKILLQKPADGRQYDPLWWLTCRVLMDKLIRMVCLLFEK